MYSVGEAEATRWVLRASWVPSVVMKFNKKKQNQIFLYFIYYSTTQKKIDIPQNLISNIILTF